MTTSICFDLDVDGAGVAHLVLKRGDELNTMTKEFWSELPELVTEADASGDVRVMVISSTGRHFSAGMDLAVFSGEGLGAAGAVEPGRRHARLMDLVGVLQETFTCLNKARFPVLAAIQGGCIGGAVDMVTAADCRYATEDAFFCIQEINIGMTADVGTLQRLPKLIPDGVARELAYTGRRMPAAEASSVGLVNAVYPDHETMVEGVLATAADMASKSPLAIWGSKEMLNYSRDHTVDDSLRHMAMWQSGMFQPADLLEAVGAQMEQREATFENLAARPTGI